MKKLMMALAVVAMAASVQAMSVKWQVSGTAGYTAYLMAGSPASSFAKLTEITSVALDQGEIKSSGRSALYSGTTASDSLTKTSNFYIVVVTDDQTEYAISSTFAGASYVYDPNATPPESSPGMATWASSGATFKEFQEDPGPEPTPEPTSAMLMLLGMAGLALRRKQK